MKSVCVYCASSMGQRQDYADAARALGTLLAKRKLALVYGGAKVGLMGTVAQAALDAGGRVVGVIPRLLVEHEIAHEGLTQLHVVENMHERKAKMATLADAFIAMPGGLGTLEEIFEIATWAQLGLHTKPVGLLNVSGYYDHLAAFLDHATDEGLLKAKNRKLILVDDDATRLIDRFAAYHVKPAPKLADVAEA